jgi:hypothetical protein
MNLGEKTAEWLATIGIHTAEDLAAYGVAKAYHQLKQSHPRKATVNVLYALQGALMGVKWDLLPEDLKDELRRQVAELDAQAVDSPT